LRHKDSGEALPTFDLGENFRQASSSRRRPGIKNFPPDTEVVDMFRGMTIEELIKSVERAEQHAREGRELKMNFDDYPVRRMEMRELIEVA
jgi:hypothetical protein